MANQKNNKSKADWLVGIWRYNEAVSPVLFTIIKTARSFRVKAICESDGEELIISKVKWDGKALSFDTLTPSNKWRTRNTLKLISKTKAIHELTFWEQWEKL
ncbi:MAG TPA: hypothetical protein VGO57_14750 [Verrucomicrobiae bacterium]|jgi:hypothetical protein